jgi:hypothetical protein
LLWVAAFSRGGVNGDEKPPEFGEERERAPDSFARV